MNKKGQALVEFILILPIFLFMIFIMIDFGRILYSKNKLESIITNVVEMYEEDKSYEEMLDYLSLESESATISISNVNNEHVRIILIDKVDLITPLLSGVLDDPFEFNAERVIYYE